MGYSRSPLLPHQRNQQHLSPVLMERKNIKLQMRNQKEKRRKKSKRFETIDM
jgi:hypothetical protein